MKLQAATALMSRLGLDCPILQSPMLGASTPELAAATSNAGALGAWAGAGSSPQEIIETVRRIRTLTTRPYSVNLFVMDDRQPSAEELHLANELLRPYRESLGLGEPAPLQRYCQDYRAQIEALLEQPPEVVSFTFGLLDRDSIRRLQRAGSLVMGTATTVAEARAWEEAGADLISVQGSEAGGHRGSFLKGFEESSVGLFALLPQVARAVAIPVVAAGGIMDGAGIAAALQLGAAAAQLGTAFLCCPESSASAAWKRSLLTAHDGDTRITRAFSGRPARGVVNAFMEAMRPHEEHLPRYPVFNALTGEIRRAAARQDRAELLSLWAGQGVGMIRSLPAPELVMRLRSELDRLLPQPSAAAH
jgi:nitronate monooxygenase